VQQCDAGRTGHVALDAPLWQSAACGRNIHLSLVAPDDYDAQMRRSPMPRLTPPVRRRSLPIFAAIAMAVAAGCATPPPAPAPAPPPAPVPAPVVVPEPEPPKPVAAPVPELSPAAARAQAQKLVLEAVDQLQNGDEASARRTLEQVQTIEPNNDLARKLMDQIKADPQKELGAVFFRYTVQRDDSLSKLAQQYMGDRFRFHILAKYNDIANPSRLAAGQVIKIPGRAPPPAAVAAATPPAAPAAALPPVPRPGAAAEANDEAAKVAAIDSATPRSAATGLMQQGMAQQKAGNLEGAYESYREAALRDPGNRDAILQRDATRQALVRRYEREATQAFQRQKLGEAIGKWDKVLALEPANQKARLERERALDLQKRMNEKFGAK
jgi:tetratricopeptide (TPR) repeat protein